MAHTHTYFSQNVYDGYISYSFTNENNVTIRAHHQVKSHVAVLMRVYECVRARTQIYTLICVCTVACEGLLARAHPNLAHIAPANYFWVVGGGGRGGEVRVGKWEIIQTTDDIGGRGGVETTTTCVFDGVRDEHGLMRRSVGAGAHNSHARQQLARCCTIYINTYIVYGIGHHHQQLLDN